MQRRMTSSASPPSPEYPFGGGERSDGRLHSGELELRIATLNCWALPGPWPFGSKDTQLRIEKIAEHCESEAFDIVCFQELWREKYYLQIADALYALYPFSHYFHSGFTGSGVCIFSKHPIVSTLMHRYSLNGFAHHIHRGDWFGGKIVGMVEIEIGDLRANIYTTHLHAEYDRENDLYLPHRLSQAFELSQFVKHTSHGADFCILTGDFNIEPEDLGYKLILANARLHDAWVLRPNVIPGETGMTCDRPDNCYTAKSLLEVVGNGKRLDYILWKSGRRQLRLIDCVNTFNKIPDQEDMNYSDHNGVEARFGIDITGRQESHQWEPERPLIKETIGILKRGQGRAFWDRRLYLTGAVMLLLFVLISLVIDVVFPLASPFLGVFRFLLTLVIGFCVWYGVLGLTMELKALKAAKTSMRKLLND